MTTQVLPLLIGQRATAEGAHASPELVEVVQRLVAAVEELQGQTAAIAAVAKPTGGATVDAEARAAVDAIIDGAA